MYELPPHRLPSAAPVFASAWFDRAQIHAVFEGRQDGRVFVDDATRPTAALLCRTYDYYVAGNSEGPLRRFIAEAPAEPGVFQDLYGYCPIGEGWRDALLNLGSMPFDLIGRRTFRYERPPGPWPVEWCDSLPAGTRIVPIDDELARRIDREMSQFIGRLWGGYERFATDGFGYCAFVDGAPVSVAYTAAVGAGEANIDVETVEPFWRRGLSAVTSAAYIDRCQALGLVATWDSDAGNAASLATARKLGFTEDRPFWEVAPRRRRRVPLTSGVWRGERDLTTGITAWSRQD